MQYVCVIPLLFFIIIIQLLVLCVVSRYLLMSNDLCHVASVKWRRYQDIDSLFVFADQIKQTFKKIKNTNLAIKQKDRTYARMFICTEKTIVIDVTKNVSKLIHCWFCKFVLFFLPLVHRISILTESPCFCIMYLYRFRINSSKLYEWKYLILL